MSNSERKREDPATVRTQLRNRVRGGSNVLLDSMNAEELVAAQEMIFQGEAEIVLSACKPFLVAKLNRIIIS